MSLLPQVKTEEEYEKISQNEELCQSVLETIKERHKLSGSIFRYKDGTQIVSALGDNYVVKVFAPISQKNADNEIHFLEYLSGKMSLETPELLVHGKIDNWPYLVMRKLPGTLLKDIWPSFLEKEQISLCQDIGKATKELHQVPFQGTDSDKAKWQKFVSQQQRACLEKQKKLGLSEKWLKEISFYTQKMPEHKEKLVLLHTELMLDHLLVKEENGTWKLSGLIDFEPSMPGHHEYEFSSVGVFISQGNSRKWRAFLEAYGYSLGDLDENFSHRIMCYLLLHRYCHLPWFLSLVPKEFSLQSLKEAADFWFSV